MPARYAPRPAAGLTGRAAALADDATRGRGRVRAGILRGLPAFLARYRGLDVDGLLAGVGLSAAALADPDAWVEHARVAEALERAAAAAGDAGLGLAFGAQLPWRDLGVFGHVVFHSPTLGAALGNACRYIAMQSTAARPALTVDGDVATLRHVLSGDALGPPPQNAELTLALFTRVAREGTAQPAWAPRAVHLRRRDGDVAAQRRFFGAPVELGRPADALVLRAADLRSPMHTADAALLPILLRHADEVLAALPAADDLPGEVRRAIAAALGGGDVTIEDVAAALASSPRSLQRRLHAHGLSFKALVAETRLAMARRYLDDPSLSLTEAAYLLGYADLSAFSRAFRKWTGRSPLDHRRGA